MTWLWRWEGDMQRRMNIELHSLSRGTSMGLDDEACDALMKESLVFCTRMRKPNQTGRYTLTKSGTERRNATTDGCTVNHCPCKRG